MHRKTIVLVGDVHDETERLGRTLAFVEDRRVDLVLLAGDIGADPPWQRAQRRTGRAGHDASIRAVVARARAACDCPVVFVPGNHDLDDPPGDVGGLNADRRVVEVGGLRIAGFGGAGTTPFRFPYEWSEEEAETALAQAFDEVGPIDLLLSHSPPSGTVLDRTSRGLLVGSPAVRRWITRLRPKLFVCGHIHEAWGCAWLDGVPCVNAGALGAPFGRDMIWVVEWCDGPARILSLSIEEGTHLEERVWEAR